MASVTKIVIVLNNEIINVGEWDYQYYEQDGEQVAGNPLPEKATIEEREMQFTEKFGWREVGFVPPISEIELLKEENASMKIRVQLAEQVSAEAIVNNQQLLELLIEMEVI